MPTNIFSLSFSRFVPRDPRYYQIAVLASLLVYGVGWLSFDTGGREITILLASALITQFLCGHYLAAATFDPRSALISGLSLCLLLRTNSIPPADRYRGSYDREQVYSQVEPQTYLQSNQLRHRRHDRAQRRSVGFAGAVGQQALLRLSDGMPGRHGRAPRAAQRRELRIYSFLRRDPFRQSLLARRSAGDSA